MSSKQSFSKPAFTYAQQLARLRSRGLVVNDATAALKQLGQLNYYRFSGYLLSFEQDHATHTLIAGTKFEQVMDLYRFDRTLRQLCLSLIELVEVSLRTRFAYELAHHGGAMSYTDVRLFRNEASFRRDFERFDGELSRADEVFLDHFSQNYSDAYPPVWAAVEVMTLGVLSRFFENLGPSAVRKAISDTYALPLDFVTSAFRVLTVVRNRCAHHSRLWDSRFNVQLARLKRGEPQSLSKALPPSTARGSVYAALTVLIFLARRLEPNNAISPVLIDLIREHPDYLNRMGFPANFHTFSLWS